MVSSLVFVYGTLKRGYGNHDYLESALFVSEVLTEPQYEMFSAPHGGFPVVVPGSKRISGEVYRIDQETLRELDILESNGLFYARELAWIESIEDWVWIYVFIRNITASHYKRPLVKVVDDIEKWEGLWDS